MTLVALVEKFIMLPRLRSFSKIKDSLFRSIIALEAWDYAKMDKSLTYMKIK